MARELDAPVVHITSYSVNHGELDQIYCPDPAGKGFKLVGRVPQSMARLTVELEMDATPGALDIMDGLAKQRNGFHFGVPRREFRCIWCSCVNPVDARFCSQCGGPRGWIL